MQTKVDGGKYVTNVAKDGDGIVITWNDNTTSTISTIKGDKGDKGDSVVITIDPETNNWVIDGEDTGICAKGKDGANGEAGEKGEDGKDGVDAKAPSIDETTGNWVVYTWNAETEEYDAVDTGVSAKGASTYVVDMGNYYELHVATSETGAETTVVKLPKNPTTITEIEILGTTDGNNNFVAIVGGVIKYGAAKVGHTLSDAQKKWNKESGVKKIAADQIISTLDRNNLLVRVAPATLDASQFSFVMINSQMKEAPIVLGTPKAYTGLLTRASVSGNGLWVIPTSAKEGETYETVADYNKNFVHNSKKVAFALKEADKFVTNYDLTFDNSFAFETPLVEKVNGVNVKGARSTDAYTAADLQGLTEARLNPVSVGKVTVSFKNASNVYDAHLHFDAATIERFGIEYSGNGTSFNVTKLPDQITAANFQVQVHYVAYEDAGVAATVKSEWVPFRVMKSYANQTVLEAKDIKITPYDYLNAANFDLSPMYSDLSNVTLWQADVDNPTFALYKVTESWPYYALLTGGANAKLTGYNSTEWKNATGVKVSIPDAGDALDPEEEYFFILTYTDAQGDILNTVKIPFTISLPALSEIFVEQDGVFNHSTHTAAAWLDGEANPAGAPIAATYNFKSAFNNLAKTVATTTFDAELDPYNVIALGDGWDKKSSAQLATLSQTTGLTGSDVDNWTITLNNVYNDYYTKAPLGYGKDLIVNVKNIKYLNKYDMGDAVYTFKINVKSPLLEGKVVAVGGEVEVPATKLEGYNVNDSHINGYTYNNIKYSIFSDVAAPEYWKRKEINSVKFYSSDENIFTCDETGKTYVPAAGNNVPAVPGYVVVYPKNLDYTTSAKMIVNVTDAWGYVLTQEVKVTVKVGE